MSLNFPTFRPHPLIYNGHLQTVMGCYLPWRRVAYRAVHRHVTLPDGDRIVLHDDCPSGSEANSNHLPNEAAEGANGTNSRPLKWRYDKVGSAWSEGDPVVLLVHGLNGCHQSGYMRRCSAKFNALGMRVFRMDLRGCGAGFPFARHPIHAGRSEDAGEALHHILQLCPRSPIHVIGFSMGANIVLKMAGEMGADAPSRLASLMAVSPPIDLMECSKNITLGANHWYDRNFVKILLRHVARRTKTVPGALTTPLDPLPRKLIEFDSLFTAPLAGFASAHDYYARASSAPLLRHIAVPTLILAAADDPIVPVGPFAQAKYSSSTKVVVAPGGGHLGFIAAGGIDPDRRWLDWRAIDWVMSHQRSIAALPNLKRDMAAHP